MYILFLLFGILLYFLINKYDAFSVGVPYVKIYFSTRDNQYYLVNMEVGEPEPQDVDDPLYDGYVEQDTYQTMTVNLESDNTRDPRLSPDCIPESIPGTTCERLTDNTILLELFKTQLMNIKLYDKEEDASNEAEFMLRATHMTYQDLIDRKLITQEQAIEYMSKRPDILRRFRIIPQVQMSASPLQAARSPRLPKECAAHIASFVGSDVLYEWLLRNIDSVDFDILAQYFDPKQFIDFFKKLNDMDITFNFREINPIAGSFSEIYIIHIIPILTRNDNENVDYDPLDFAINIFTKFLQLSQLNNNFSDGDVFESGRSFQDPDIDRFLWLLENNHLGENHTLNPQFIIDTYIDVDDTFGLLDHLLRSTDFANTTQLRDFLIDPTDNYINLYSMISHIVDFLYEYFNAGR
jgi:hypothetical protein